MQTREGRRGRESLTPPPTPLGFSGASDRPIRAQSHPGTRKGESASLPPSFIHSFIQTLWRTYCVPGTVSLGTGAKTQIPALMKLTFYCVRERQ